ncbi:MAG: ribose-5-phosphate isomerase RpiA [Thermoleophilaceae bacterium]
MSADPARAAAAAAAVELIEPGMTIGLGSGRAVWRVIELLGARPATDRPRAAFASDRTRELAREAGIEEVALDGETRLDLAIDGADEVGPRLGLIKGGGAALLREKIVIEAAERFVVVAETAKRVERLGESCRLPVEVVRFGWRDTRRRLLGLVPSAELRTADRGEPIVTDEGHHLLDCEILADVEPEQLATAIKSTVGVVEHGLFLGMASVALLGTPEGEVERLDA